MTNLPLPHESHAPVWQLSALDLADAFAAGTLKPGEVLEAVLARADAIDPMLNVFAARDDAAARAAAAESDRRWAEGRQLSRFDGVPIAIKDNITAKGLPCAWGSRLFLDNVPEKDELPVARLRGQGWVVIGKSTVSEFTLGRGNIDTPAFGTTRNPWDTDLTTGASTGGGAAAVATGIGPLGLGTDGGGSIRWPASYCGLVGLKPSMGRIARRHGLPVVLHDLEVISPIGRTVGDVEALLAAVSEPDPHDRASLAFAAGTFDHGGERPARILYVPSFGAYEVEPEIARSVAEVAQRLRTMGHTVETGAAPFDFDYFDSRWRVFTMTGVASIVHDRERWEGEVGEIYPPMVKEGASYSAVDYLLALRMARTVFDQMAGFFQEWDLLLTPVAGAMPRGARELAPPYQRVFTGFTNVAGIPAISLPGPASSGGVPIGFQLVAPYGGEGRLLSIGKAYETAYPWRHLWPNL